jgi:hypothetical protein
MIATEEMFEQAMRIGEAHGEQAIKLAFRIRDLRRAMWRAIRQLESGKTSEAKQSLHRGIREDDNR